MSLKFFSGESVYPSFFIRSFSPLLVLALLIFHQFLFIDFIEPQLSVVGYSLCFFILFLESIFLFFLKENQKINFDLLLFFFSALFLSGLLALIGGPLGFFVVLLLAFIQVFSLFSIKKAFTAFVFLVYLSLLFPLAFLWNDNLLLKERQSLVLLSFFVLTALFAFSFLFHFLLNNLAHQQKKEQRDFDRLDLKTELDFTFSLNFAKKLKPFLNSFSKSLSGDKNKEALALPLESKSKLESFKVFISDFLDYAGLNKKELSLEVFNLKELLAKALAELKTHPKRPENIKEKLECPDGFMLKADKSYLKKGLQHIFINSFEACHSDKESFLNVYVFKQRNWAVIQISDNGHGIEEEGLNKVFEPFFTKRLGFLRAGLGLSYVQKLIQIHEGELKAESLKEGGLRITIRLPLMRKSDFTPSKKIIKKAV